MASLRNTAILGLMPQVMFFVGVSIEPLPLPWFYAILFLLLNVQVFWYYLATKSVPFKLEEYKFGEAPKQIAAGAAAGVGITSLLAVLTPIRIGPSFFQEFMIQVVFVGFVETFDLIVTTVTIPSGKFVWPFKFALEHWYVRDAIVAGDPLLTAFLISYTAVFGILFWLLYHARETQPAGRREWFGAVTSWSAHVAVNLMLILFPLAILGFEFLPLTFGSR